jgi:uncharacterized protein (TIGR00661 family)
MKIMFTVQGDGRGHMTQAMAAAQILEHQGHEIVAVTVGTNPSRTIPEFFRREFGERLRPIASPGFCFQAGKGVAPLATLRRAISGIGHYRESLAAIAGSIKRTQPDLIVNFLEPLVGLFNLRHPHQIPVVSIGHQFMLGHPEFVRSPRFALQQWMMRQYVRLAGARSTKLALSFYPAAPIPEDQLFVCPPLLRAEVFEQQCDQPGRFLLAYVLNQGYAEDILRWHAAFPDVELHCFCEKPKVEPVWRYDSTLSFHKLDGAKFLRMMAESRGVACTAGFESLNEAAWLGKPLLVVPVANHVEQYLNALDAEKAGLALAADKFDLTPLIQGWKAPNLDAYRSWVGRAGSIILSLIEEATHKAVREFIPFHPVGHSSGLAFDPSGVPSSPEASSQNKCSGKPRREVSSFEVASHR